MSFNRYRVTAWLMTSLMAVLVAGCGGGGYGGGSSGSYGMSATSGTLYVSLTDAPACGFDKVYVTVSKVRVNQSSTATDTDPGWTDITLSPAQKIDLLSLNNGVFMSLGQTPLAAGHYTQVRLLLDPNANSVVVTGSTSETPLVTPSAVQTGIKLINQFDVVAGQRTDLMLDFNACQSIVKRGNGTYALMPVIKAVPFAMNGIDGFVDIALLTSNVMVTAQQSGVIVQSTAPDAQTGEFFLSRLPLGNYDVVITADGHAPDVITTVPITSATSVVNLSTSVARTFLSTSTNHTVSGTAALNPASTTAVAYVAAKQTLGTTPVVVQSVAADDTSSPPGAYTLTLPIAAPQLGLYSMSLPIMLTAQSAVAAQYSIEASATGYQTQVVTKDISAGNITQSFTLVP